MLQSSSSEKKLVKPLKNCFFGPNLHRKGAIMGHTQDGKFFFLPEITKADHQLSERFYQNIICFDWVMNLYLSWVMFSVKKVLFPVKTAVLIDWLMDSFSSISAAICLSFKIFCQEDSKVFILKSISSFPTSVCPEAS